MSCACDAAKRLDVGAWICTTHGLQVRRFYCGARVVVIHEGPCPECGGKHYLKVKP